jgi:hypothetical protein
MTQARNAAKFGTYLGIPSFALASVLSSGWDAWILI